MTTKVEPLHSYHEYCRAIEVRNDLSFLHLNGWISENDKKELDELQKRISLYEYDNFANTKRANV